MKIGLTHRAIWKALYRLGWARPWMPQWRVVVEGRIGERIGVTGVLVWAMDAEEAEALAQLALSAEGIDPITADATPTTPQCAPSRTAKVCGRSALAWLDAPHEGRPVAAKGQTQ